MVIECISIIIVLMGLVLAFLRAHRKKYAFAVIPLMILPALHLLSYPTSVYLHKFFGAAELSVQHSVTVIALVISCLALGMMSRTFSSRRNRAVFIGICGIYTVILALILILK